MFKRFLIALCLFLLLGVPSQVYAAEDNYEYDYASEDFAVSDGWQVPTSHIPMQGKLGMVSVIAAIILCIVCMVLNLIPYLKIGRSLGVSGFWMLVPIVGWYKFMCAAVPEDEPKRKKIALCQVPVLLCGVAMGVAPILVGILRIIGAIIMLVLIVMTVVIFIRMIINTYRGFKWIDAAVKCVDYDQASGLIAILAIFCPIIWWFYALIKY